MAKDNMELKQLKSESTGSRMAAQELTDASQSTLRSVELVAANDDVFSDRTRETSSIIPSASSDQIQQQVGSAAAEEGVDSGIVDSAVSVDRQTETDRNKNSVENQTTENTMPPWKTELLLRLQRALVVTILLFLLVPIVGGPALLFYLRSRRAVTSGDQGVAIRSERIVLYLIASGGVLLTLGLFVGSFVLLGEMGIRLNNTDAASQDNQHLTATTINLAASLDYMKSLLTRDNKRTVLCMSKYEKKTAEVKDDEDVNFQQPITFLLRNQLPLDDPESEC